MFLKLLLLAREYFYSVAYHTRYSKQVNGYMIYPSVFSVNTEKREEVRD
jgi:hypothetical protein